MADIFLSPVLQVIIDKLASPVLEKFGNVWDQKDNILKLQANLPMVQALLEDAERQQSTSAAVRIWISKLKDVASEAEDLLLDLTSSSGLANIQYADKVRHVLLALETITDEGLRLNLREVSAVQREWDRRETSSFIIESEVYGREEDCAKITELLCPDETSRVGKVSCVSIVGMPGIGKTTLAQLVYNSESVTKFYDARVWIFVSDRFDAKKIMTVVVESLTKEKCSHLNMDGLHSEAWNLLHKKRYLIVLDDVWTENPNDWGKLKPLFRGGVEGSKIMITTRSRKVALMMNCPTFPYDLNGLSEDACWLLFKQRAFHHGEGESYSALLPIGREIVRKCGGLALAAETLGSLMRFKREIQEWVFVRDSDLWSLDEIETGILPALRLSYSHLPSHLKRCFTFCSVFPRHYEFGKDKLVNLWVAEGLIQSRSGRPLEDIGAENFNDLLWMSFFQEVKQSSGNLVIGYKIHDVFYDFVQSIAESEYAVLDCRLLSTRNYAQTRHSSVIFDFASSAIPQDLYGAKRLRTLLLFSGGGNFGEIPSELFSSFKFLLALDLSWSSIKNVDVSMGRLSCLKFLDLSHTPIKRLPREVEELPLQTLDLMNCYDLEALPELENMRSLRHLNNIGCQSLTSVLSSYPMLSQFSEAELVIMVMKGQIEIPKKRQFVGQYELRTLPLFVVGDSDDIKFLGKLDLHGSLRITHLENVYDGIAASYAELMKKKGIESLGLYWGNDDISTHLLPKKDNVLTNLTKRKSPESSRQPQSSDLEAPSAKSVLTNLQPHQNLKRLVIKGYPGVDFPCWSLPYLNSIELIHCKNSKYLPELGNLQFLKRILLCTVHGVKRIGHEFYGGCFQKSFRALEELSLIDFPNLEEWLSPYRGECFPSLIKLVVIKCPRLGTMPHVRSIQHLELRDCKPSLVHVFRDLASLKSLVIDKVRGLLCFVGAFPVNNPSLSSLEIKSCPGFRFLPHKLGSLTSLTSLVIRWCSDLSSLPPSLQNLSALESLEIGDCHGLTSLPEDETRGLSNLRNLSIENCNKLTCLSPSFQHLTSLEHLTVMYCPSIIALPRCMEHARSLRSLTIMSCPALSYLPQELQNLGALHSLEIRSCPGLKALPEWIEMLVSLRSLTISDCHNIRFLPEGFKKLTALQHLTIQDCPDLVAKCAQQGGEDWPKISHVPYKHIGSPEQNRPGGSGSA